MHLGDTIYDLLTAALPTQNTPDTFTVPVKFIN